MSKLSVIAVVHDQLPMNRLFLESLRATTDGPYELIVVDNASSDGTDDIIRSYADRGIELVRQPRRSGSYLAASSLETRAAI